MAIKAVIGSATSQEHWGRGRRAAGSRCRGAILGVHGGLRAGPIWL